MIANRPPHDVRNAERAASLSRRRFLRGAGACLGLPAFESLLRHGSSARAAGLVKGLAATPAGAPLRLAFVYVPNGTIPSAWWPKEGSGDSRLELNRTMEPLEGLKPKFQVIGGLDHVNATPGPDGAGDHARASGSFLTGVRVRKTAGSNIHAGISIDQLVANRVGSQTRFASLELSCDAVRRAGNCDSGYSCAYQYNLAWRSPTNPMPPEPNPRLVFERLFGSGSHGERKESLKRRQQQQRSILDFVLDDARSLQRELPVRDQRKLDEYLVSVREIEGRIAQAERLSEAVPDPAVDTPPGIPSRFEEHVQLMYDMMVLAFQTDSTRVATMLLASEGSNRAFPEIGIAEGHHALSHHRGEKDMIDKVADIDRFYVAQFGRFLEKLDALKDVDGNSLLDNAMIVYGSGNADGNRHTHTNLPVIVAGRGGGTLVPGRYFKAGGVPMTNLYLSLVDRLGIDGVEEFGDSTGRLTSV